VLALTYDPKVLTVSSSDIRLGSIPGSGTGWHLVSAVDQATGQIGIDLYSTTAISATQAGSLVNIAFRVVPGAAVPVTAVQLASAVTPNGRFFSTEVADDQGQYVLSSGMDRLLVGTGYPASLANAGSEGWALPNTASQSQILLDTLARRGEPAGESSFIPVDFAVATNSGPEFAGVEPHSPGFVLTVVMPVQANSDGLMSRQGFYIGNASLLNGILSPGQLPTDQALIDLIAASTDASTSEVLGAALAYQDWSAILNLRQTPLRDITSGGAGQSSTQPENVSDYVICVDRVFAGDADSLQE
jgi:hypothetical protein